jgi:hypothetical protein
MANLGTTLTEWAEEMKVGVPQGTRNGLNHINTGSYGRSPAPDDPTYYSNASESVQHMFSLWDGRSHAG